MALQTLQYEPSWPPSKQKTPESQDYDFGEGYSQRVGTGGTNPTKQIWAGLLWKNMYRSEADALESFFDTHDGRIAFEWTPPGDSSPRKFIAKTWKVTYTGADTANVTADFKEVFDL